MTAAETQAAMDAFFEALLTDGAYENYFTEDVALTMTGVPGETTGPEAVKAAVEAIHHEQFDANPELTNLVVGEGTTAAELIFAGTHAGEFAGIPATGKSVEVPYSVFYELSEDKITSVRIYALVEGLVQQLQADADTGDSQKRTMSVMKECSEYTGEAGSFCTITSSNFDATRPARKSSTPMLQRPPEWTPTLLSTHQTATPQMDMWYSMVRQGQGR